MPAPLHPLAAGHALVSEGAVVFLLVVVVTAFPLVEDESDAQVVLLFECEAFRGGWARLATLGVLFHIAADMFEQATFLLTAHLFHHFEGAVVDAETECSTVSLGVLFSHGICYFDVIGSKINRSNHKKRVIMI